MTTSLDLLESLGFSHDGQSVVDAGLGARLAFVRSGETTIELVEPLPDHNSLLRTLGQRPGPYHYAFETELDGSQLLDAVRARKFLTIVEETEAVAFPKHLVSFYMSREGTVIEILRSLDAGRDV